MNKNTIIGLVIIGAILFGFSWWNSGKVKERQEIALKEQARIDSINKANAPVISAEEQLIKEAEQDSIAAIRKAEALGSLATAAAGEEQFFKLENNLAIYTFSTKGGRIASVELKDYKRLNEANKGQALLLFSPEGNDFGFEFFAPERVSTSNLFFEPRKISDTQIAFRLIADSVNYIEYTYTIAPNNYMMSMKADFSSFRALMTANQPELTLNWSIVSPQEEKGFENENNYTTVAYKYPGDEGEVEELSASTDAVNEDIPTKVQWVAFKQQFFSSIIVAQNDFGSAKVGYTTFPAKADDIKTFNANLTLPYSPSADTYDFNFYFGPNKFSTLNDYGDKYEFQELVPLGWWIIGWVNRWIVIPTFDFLSEYISNYGVIILLLTIFIKLITFPLTYKSYLSTAKMRLLAPELKKINEKYPKKEDALKKQQSMMALYKSAGVSPMGGCLPMLIQMPFLIAMFRFFPSSIELRGESFLWATDLSSYDSIWDLPFNIPFYGDHVSLFTLLMAVSLFLTSKINYQQQSAMQTQQMPGMKFMMLYMMPVLLLFMFNNFSSALCYYFLLSNLISIGQTYACRYAVSDEKLHARMKANAEKPVKKSKFAERIETMQRQQQEAMRQQQGGKKR